MNKYATKKAAAQERLKVLAADQERIKLKIEATHKLIAECDKKLEEEYDEE